MPPVNRIRFRQAPFEFSRGIAGRVDLSAQSLFQRKQAFQHLAQHQIFANQHDVDIARVGFGLLGHGTGDQGSAQLRTQRRQCFAQQRFDAE